ncbi:Txe/YoeB family addiction module toxin [Colwellia sp. MB02u-18]|uniref:Txe/YoeB family addiction module toxin n=1 Tax=unclassified Colwellia TaxID=196834 RepID=UPI0015F35C53|nr:MULTISPECIES: Txe/YoeB family addiction module toxin [unclassified Colwellia]MBA6222635.1 Txe/YoeB family addiction module toxin [Colwellia sp. MB3u-45]MBA6269177.1 Txe/YoeB family addiction module toxin [Colwellia sp. MB3u-43]MBA6322768.1 Txe/YoeB family addiction module toxin [Colwellia sp. MB02u-19]MBA6323459.1 Txe/YoeB family addiction module toxin [Colwellia sp. MB02u-18]MBA6332911.1 Txe/YoeB family addiction module toxin [Colwellia sp. MB02u-12]
MARLLAWTNDAWADYVYWQGQDKKTLKRINKLITDTKRSPFEGIGKPEPLKENLSGFWSRRVDESNRLVYAVSDSHITVISCRYHY